MSDNVVDLHKNDLILRPTEIVDFCKKIVASMYNYNAKNKPVVIENCCPLTMQTDDLYILATRGLDRNIDIHITIRAFDGDDEDD